MKSLILTRLDREGRQGGDIGRGRFEMWEGEMTEGAKCSVTYPKQGATQSNTFTHCAQSNRWDPTVTGAPCTTNNTKRCHSHVNSVLILQPFYTVDYYFQHSPIIDQCDSNTAYSKHLIERGCWTIKWPTISCSLTI